MKTKLPRPDISTFKFKKGTGFLPQKFLCKYSLWTVSVTVNQSLSVDRCYRYSSAKTRGWPMKSSTSEVSHFSILNQLPQKIAGIASWQSLRRCKVPSKQNICANQRLLIDGLINTNVIWHFQLLLTRWSIWCQDGSEEARQNVMAWGALTRFFQNGLRL